MAPRGKVVLARINNETKRRASLRKRQAGLLKKVSELTTLCDAKAAVVIYNPGNNQPTVWPSTSEAKATISKFLSRPEPERMANSHTAKSFMEGKCRKMKNKAQRLIKMNEDRDVQALITSLYTGKARIQDLDSEQQETLSDVVDKKKKELLKHIQRLKAKEQQTPHSTQVLPPVQMPHGSHTRRGVNMNDLASGRSFPSPASAHEQLMNIKSITQLAPPLPLSLPTHNPLVMSTYDSEANRHDVTRRLYGQTRRGGMMQRALHQSQALPPAQQMPPLTQVASGVNINGLSSGGNFSSPAALAHGQYMNLRGMTRGAPPPIPLSLPTPNSLVMSLDNSAVSSLDKTQSLPGQTDLGGMMQHPLPSTLSMPPPALSALPSVFSARSVPDLNDYNFITTNTRAHTGEGTYGIMNQHAPPPSLPLDYSLIHPSSYRLHMTGRLYEQMNSVGMMQHSLDMTDNGLINANLRTFTEDGNFGETIQHGPPHMPLELPRRLGLSPTEYAGSGSNMFSDGYGWSTVRFPTPATTELDQSNFGNDYIWNINGFPAPATAAFDQSNLDGGMSNAGWVNGDTAFEVRNAPPFNL